MKRYKRFFWLFLIPSLFGVAVFVLLPFGDVVRRSFTTAVTGEFVGIKNYQVILHNRAFLLAIKNTLRFTLIGIPLLVFLGLLIAFPLSRLGNAGFIKSVYLFPLTIPTAVIVMVWKMIFYKKGFLNLLLWQLGEKTGLWQWQAVDYLGTGAAFWVLIVSYLWKNTGYTIILWLAGIMNIPPELSEAAEVDGAGKWKSFFYIILPNLKGSLYTIVTLSFLNSFKIYREAYLTAGSYPQESIYLMQHLFNNWYVNLELDKMAAAAVCTAVFLFLVNLLLQRLWDKGEE